ncbi:MAG: hypothetical protein JNL98_31305, partial [Bryobacterales bacterium]|nr:hypothetical protein [Bryobacterales bacterium]
MRNQLLPIALITVASLTYVFSQQGQAPSASGGAALRDDTAAVRIEFGINDESARSWNGSVAASAGRILSVRNWHPRPGDKVEGNTWTLATRQGVNFTRRAWEAEALTDPTRYFLIPGVIVDASGQGAELKIETAHGSFNVRPFDLVPGTRTSFLNGAVVAERVPSTEKLSADGSNNDFAALVDLPDGKLLSGWVNFADNRNELHFRMFDGNAWSGITKIAKHSDIFMVKLGRDRANRAWAVWSAQVDGNWDLYASRWTGSSWTEPDRLTNDPQPDTYHAMATDSNGNLWLVWQGFRNGRSDIFTKRYTGETWTESEKVSASTANDWSPAIAADRQGRVFIAWDSYDKGNYDIHYRTVKEGRASEIFRVTEGPRFQAHVSIAVDSQGRPWLAWNESGISWGKDQGFLIPTPLATPLHQERWLKLVMRDGNQWQEAWPLVEDSLPVAMRRNAEHPQLV